jgi:abequosyltransferase
MSFHLTIAIPTYNRAHLLDRQLLWLSNELQSINSGQIEILISNNCSTDETAKVIEKWQSSFAQAKVFVNCQPTNVGAMRNILYCVEKASGDYVWVVSDDDPICQGTVVYLLNKIHQHPDLSLIILNHRSENFKTGEVGYQQCYPLQKEKFSAQGKGIFEQCLVTSIGGVTLTTALVYRASAIQQAINYWSDGKENLCYQAYLTGYCALQGSALVTSDVFLTCSLGDHFFMADPAILDRLEFQDKPVMYAKLAEIGYKSVLIRLFCQKLLRKLVLSFKDPSELANFKRRVGRLVSSKMS